MTKRVNKSNTARWNRRYGLSEDENEAIQDETLLLAEAFFDDVYGTAKSTTSLQQHPDFHKWRRERKLTAQDLEKVENKLQIYRDLRDVDPTSFRRLVKEPQNLVSLPSSFSHAALEKVLNTYLTTLLLLLQMTCISSQVYRYVVGGVLAGNLYFWLQGTSLYGKWAGLWLEDIELGHRASWQVSLLTNLIECGYSLVTCGLGFLGLPALRLLTESGQSIGERIMGLRLVKETEVPLQFLEEPRDEVPSPVKSEASLSKASGRGRGRKRK